VIFYPITAILGLQKMIHKNLFSMETFMADEQKNDTVEIYEIKLQGHLDSKWSEWFYGMTITHEHDGATTLSGPLPDQTVLHSVLDRIRDMNLQLISVNQIVSVEQTTNDEVKGVNHEE
jgi:hypothetical protein